MEYAVILFLGLACVYLTGKAVYNTKVLKLEKDRFYLNKAKCETERKANNTETRAMTFAKKIKALEDIAAEGEKINECAPVTLAKMKKELLITHYSTKK